MSILVTRYSGYRIRFLPEMSHQANWQQRERDIEPLIPFIDEARAETGFLFDDAWSEYSSKEMLLEMLKNGELFVVRYDHADHGKIFMGIVVLRGIIHEREAHLDAWAHPTVRGKLQGAKASRAIFEYAFRPFNLEATPEEKASRGLGLRKIKTQVAAPNEPALRAALRSGFTGIGVSPGDGLFKGRLTDMLILEKYNPACLAIVPPEEIADGRRTEATAEAGSANLPGAGTIHESEHIGSELRSASERDRETLQTDDEGGEQARPAPKTRRPSKPRSRRKTKV